MITAIMPGFLRFRDFPGLALGLSSGWTISRLGGVLAKEEDIWKRSLSSEEALQKEERINILYGNLG
jgi:hypothetical protein